MKCVICGIGDKDSLCPKCGAMIDARRSMFEWFRMKKQCEKEIIEKIIQENLKSIKEDKKEKYSNIDAEVVRRLDSIYYKINLENAEKRGKKQHGLIEGLHYGKGATVSLTQQEINEFWYCFNEEKEKIKMNDMYACKIYKYDNQKAEYYKHRFEFVDEAIIEFESVRKNNTVAGI